jgi:hypothetical protein
LPRNNKRDWTTIGAVVFLAGALLAGVLRLVALRFEAGDVYPAYSSLRSDPLGTKVYFEALGDLGELSVLRNYGPLGRLEDGGPAAVFFVGLHPGALEEVSGEDTRSLEAVARTGGRLVLLLLPRAGHEGSASNPREPEEDASEVSPLQDLWGLTLKACAANGAAHGSAGRAVPSPGGYGHLPPLPWHGTACFADMAPSWQAVYEVDGMPVVIERTFGRGSVVLATDSYLLSNEAMLRERHPDFLAWLVGQNRWVVFDETHLGITETPGMAALGRAYRLHGFLASLLALALLFVWKNSTSLVPCTDGGPDAEKEGTPPMGRDSMSGIVSLVRRNIAAEGLPRVCLEEWERAFPPKGKEPSEKLEQALSLVQEARDPVETYRRMSRILQERRRI